MHIGTLKWLEVPNVTSSSNYLREDMRNLGLLEVGMFALYQQLLQHGQFTGVLGMFNMGNHSIYSLV
jgi:hypothetical protein